MKRRASFIHAIVIDCLLVWALLAVLYIKYTNQYENATIIGDWKRIPLWYPHEIVNFGDMMGVRLNNWLSWKHPIDNTVTISSDAAEDVERTALQRLEDILEFSIGENVVCGIRTVRTSRHGRYFGRRYFVFATNQLEVAYFKEKDEFLRECDLYGIDGGTMMSFENCWNTYWDTHETYHPIKILTRDIKAGFKWYELLALVLLVFLLLRQLRRQFRQGIFSLHRTKK